VAAALVHQAQQVGAVLQAQTSALPQRLARVLAHYVPLVQQVIGQTTRRVLQSSRSVPALRLTDLDFDAMTITIDGSLQRINGTSSVPGKLERSDTKTEGSRRVLPMPEPVAKVLKEHLQRLEKERASADWQEQGLLFPTTVGTPMDPRNLLRHLKSVLEEAGLPANTRFHDLRHWCASLLIAYEVQPKVIQTILGHADIGTTMDIYGHLLLQVLKGATDRMNGIVPSDEDDNSDEK
jgi:integrase